MPIDSDLTDYRPLSRSSRRGIQEADVGEDGWVSHSARGSSSSFPQIADTPSSRPQITHANDRSRESATKGKAKSHEKEEKLWLFRKGHAVSYAGLFLFTIMV